MGEFLMKKKLRVVEDTDKSQAKKSVHERQRARTPLHGERNERATTTKKEVYESFYQSVSGCSSVFVSTAKRIKTTSSTQKKAKKKHAVCDVRGQK